MIAEKHNSPPLFSKTVRVAYLKGGQLFLLQLAEAFCRSQILGTTKQIQSGAQPKSYHVTYPVTNTSVT